MRQWSVVVVAVLVSYLGVGCSSPPAPLSPAAATYETRGVVERLAARNDPAMLIRHEAIPDFVGIDGKASTMGSMSMPFEVAGDVPMAGVKVGSNIAFTFEVRWEAGPPLLITKLEVLPDDAKLDVGS